MDDITIKEQRQAAATLSMFRVAITWGLAVKRPWYKWLQIKFVLNLRKQILGY